MLVEGDGFVAVLRKGTDDYGGYVTATGSEVEVVGFVEDNDEQAVFLKLRAVNERVDVVVEPSVGGAERAIMRVVAKIGDDEGIVGKIGGGQVRGKLGEENEVLCLRGVVLDIPHVGKGIMANGVIALVSAGITDDREILGVGLPGFSGGEQLMDDIIVGDGKRLRRFGIDDREYFPRGELEIIWDGRM